LIAEPQDVWPVSVRCEGLAVSRRGGDEDLPRPANASVEAAEVA
jgi:hypothetical protein